MKFGALLFVLALPKEFAINLQLLGGIWILQTLPAIVIGLYTRWLHRYALLAGWAVGMIWGTIAAYNKPVVGKPDSHFGGSVGPLEVFGWEISDNLIYFGITALVLNLLVAIIGTLVLRVDERLGRHRRDAAVGLPGRRRRPRGRGRARPDRDAQADAT